MSILVLTEKNWSFRGIAKELFISGTINHQESHSYHKNAYSEVFTTRKEKDDFGYPTWYDLIFDEGFYQDMMENKSPYDWESVAQEYDLIIIVDKYVKTDEYPEDIIPSEKLEVLKNNFDKSGINYIIASSVGLYLSPETLHPMFLNTVEKRELRRMIMCNVMGKGDDSTKALEMRKIELEKTKECDAFIRKNKKKIEEQTSIQKNELTKGEDTQEKQILKDELNSIDKQLNGIHEEKKDLALKIIECIKKEPGDIIKILSLEEVHLLKVKFLEDMLDEAEEKYEKLNIETKPIYDKVLDLILDDNVKAEDATTEIKKYKKKRLERINTEKEFRLLERKIREMKKEDSPSE